MLLVLGQASLVAQWVKNPPANAGDVGSIPGLERSPGDGNAIHCSILAWRIPMDREAWQATAPGVKKGETVTPHCPLSKVNRKTAQSFGSVPLLPVFIV